MRIPGIHVLLTAGVVAVTSIGTVAAFTLTGSGEAAPRLSDVAPPPAAAAPLAPAPLPAPAPVTDQAPADETAAGTTEPDAAPAEDGRDTDDTTEAAPAPSDENPDGPDRVRPDRNGTSEQRLAYACEQGFLHGGMCERFD